MKSVEVLCHSLGKVILFFLLSFPIGFGCLASGELEKDTGNQHLNDQASGDMGEDQHSPTDTSVGSDSSQCIPLSISKCNISPACIVINEPYSASLAGFIEGGSGDISLQIDGTLPPGLALVGYSIQGTPTKTGAYDFKILYRDNCNPAQLVSYWIAVFPSESDFSEDCDKTCGGS